MIIINILHVSQTSVIMLLLSLNVKAQNSIMIATLWSFGFVYRLLYLLQENDDKCQMYKGFHLPRIKNLIWRHRSQRERITLYLNTFS